MPRLSCKYSHVLAVKADGTVAFAGKTTDGQDAVSSWANIVSVATGYAHSVGLKSDGTVVACGSNANGQCNVSGWTGIVEICAHNTHTVGLKSDGTVVACGEFYDGSAVAPLSNLAGSAHLFCGYQSAAGLKSDGTFAGYCYGHNDYAYHDVASWTDVVSMSVGGYRAIGVKTDGTIALSGNTSYDGATMQTWSRIFAVSADRYGTFGLSLCGRVLCAGQFYYDKDQHVSSWENVCDIDCSTRFVVGLKSDGTALFGGSDDYGIQAAVSGWSGLNPTTVNFTICAPAHSNSGLAGLMYFPASEAPTETHLQQLGAGVVPVYAVAPSHAGNSALGTMYFPSAEASAFASLDVLGAGKYENKRGFHRAEIQELAIVDDVGLRLPILSADVQISGDAGVSTVFVVPFNTGKSWLLAAQPPFRVVDSTELPLFMFDSLDWSEYRGAHRTSLVFRTSALDSIRLPGKITLPAPFSISSSGSQMVTLVGAWDVASGDVADCGGVISTVVRAAHIHCDRDFPRTIIYG